MRAVVGLVSAFAVARAGRVVNVNDNAEAVDLGDVSEQEVIAEQFAEEEDEEADAAELDAWEWDEDELEANFKKWESINAGDMQKRFSSGDEAMLMPGETVELAWKQGKFDVLCFTNLRFFEADGKASFGKVQKTKYTSALWRTLGSWSAETLGGGMDRDVELTMHDAFVTGGYATAAGAAGAGKFTKKDAGKIALGAALGSIFAESSAAAQMLGGMQTGHWEFDFHKKEDIMEINKFVEKKVLEAKAWQADNNIALQKAQSVMFAQNAKHHIPNGMSKLKAISNDQGAKVLARDGPFMMDGEKLLYSFTETRWSRDHIYLTNKRAILADRKRGAKSKTHYVSVPHDDKPFNMINTWEVETAGPMDKDCELRVGTITGHNFNADFAKKVTSSKDLFDMQMDIQKQIFQ